jgi:argininosuccinate lyase
VADFAAGPSDALVRLSASVHFDWRLAPYDLRASAAHARVLHRAGLLTVPSSTPCWVRWTTSARPWPTGSSSPPPRTRTCTPPWNAACWRVGPLGGKLRAGRSRNDQVATDLRLYLREHARTLALAVADLQNALIGQAADHLDVAMPGMTHLPARPAGPAGPPPVGTAQAFDRDLSRTA